MRDMVPENLRYATTHEWCRLDGDMVIIGVTEHGVAALGGIIYVELPEEKEDVLHELPFGEIEGTRDVRDLSSPFDGVVLQVNSRVVQNPDVLLKDPYEEGWLVRLKPDSPASLDNLLSPADYAERTRKRKG